MLGALFVAVLVDHQPYLVAGQFESDLVEGILQFLQLDEAVFVCVDFFKFFPHFGSFLGRQLLHATTASHGSHFRYLFRLLFPLSIRDDYDDDDVCCLVCLLRCWRSCWFVVMTAMAQPPAIYQALLISIPAPIHR